MESRAVVEKRDASRHSPANGGLRVSEDPDLADPIIRGIGIVQSVLEDRQQRQLLLSWDSLEERDQFGSCGKSHSFGTQARIAAKGERDIRCVNDPANGTKQNGDAKRPGAAPGPDHIVCTANGFNHFSGLPPSKLHLPGHSDESFQFRQSTPIF
jgi:hypothetical protein